MNKLYCVVLLSTLLGACGGGGSESSTTPPPQSPVVPAPIQNQTLVTDFSLQESQAAKTVVGAQSTAQRTHEITVPNGFALSSERSFNLAITLSEDDNQPAYLSLCSDYEQLSEGNYTINYDSCLLRTPLSGNKYETVITVTNDTEGLVAALWYRDKSKQPIMVDWRF